MTGACPSGMALVLFERRLAATKDRVLLEAAEQLPARARFEGAVGAFVHRPGLHDAADVLARLLHRELTRRGYERRREAGARR